MKAMLFTVSGNGPHASLKEDLDATGTNRDHYVVGTSVRGRSPGLSTCHVPGRRWKTLQDIDESTASGGRDYVDASLGRFLIAVHVVADA